MTKLSYEISLMTKHRRFFASFCVKNKATTYQMLLLKLAEHFKSTVEIADWIINSEYMINDDTFEWPTTKLEMRNFNVQKINRSFKTQLATRKQWIELEGKRGITGNTVELKPAGKELLALWEKAVESFLGNQVERARENESIVAKIERNIETVDEEGSSIFLDIEKLEPDLKALLKTEGETTYLKICQSLIAQREELQDPNSLTQIFFKVPKDGELSNDYMRKGLCQVKGWITGHSEVRDLQFGTVYRCSKDEEHITIETDSKNQIDLCPYCSANVKKIMNLAIPVREIHMETKSMDRFRLIIHAKLWSPSTSPSQEQNLVLFKMSDKFSRVINGSPVSNVNYLAVGVEKEEEPEYNLDRAKELADKSTDEIISTISNSLYSDIAGLGPLKESLILTMGSINTQKLLVEKKGEWKEERGIINTLFWGVEGTAKTAATQRIVSLMSHRLSKGQAGNTSARGLTAAYDKETRSVRAGIIPLNDTRVCLIDELDKFPAGTFQSLLEPLENKVLTYSKAGLNVQFPSRTVIFMTANNINEISSDCLEQLKQEIDKHGGKRTPVIDRCDLIIVIREGTSGLDVLDEWMSAPTSKIISVDDVRNFYENVRTISEVKIGKEILATIFKLIKGKNIKIMPRRINSLLRLTGAVAKLHLRAEATPQDAEDAVKYYLQSLETIGEVGYVIEHIDSESKESKIEQLVLDRLEIPMEEIELQVFFSENISLLLQRMKNNRLVFLGPDDKWRKVK